MKTATAISNLLVAFNCYLRQKQIGTVLHRTFVILKNKEYVLLPDIIFVKKGRADIIRVDAIYGSPDLVLEVWVPSLTNFEKFLRKKKKIYEECGVQEYWIADPYDRSIIKNVLIGGTYKEMMESDLFPNLEITL
jgi:Uma2 family endonuclease